MPLAIHAASTTVTDNVTLDGVTEINVASGDTTTYSGQISGTGAINKTGDGTLILSHPAGNDYSGGTIITLGTICADSSGALGSGPVTTSGGTNKSLKFRAPNGIFPNDLTLGAGAACPLTFDSNTTVNGTVSLSREHNFLQNDSAETVIFNNIISAPYTRFIHQSKKKMIVNGALDVLDVYAGSSNGQSGSIELCNPDNKIGGLVCLVSEQVICRAKNVLNGASLAIRGANGSSAAVNLDRYDQTVRSIGVYATSSLVRPDVTATGRSITSTAPATLTLTGTGAGKSDMSYFAVEGQVTLAMEADATFRQVFTNRTSTTTGELRIGSGILAIEGDATFSNVGRVTVGTDGAIKIDSSRSLSLGGVTNLVLAGSLSATRLPFTEGILVLEVSGSSASLTLPEGARLTLKSLTVDGEPRSGEFAAGNASCPWLTGGEVVVEAQASTASWTGAAGTTSISAGGNWDSGSKPDFSGFCTATFAAKDAVGFTATVDTALTFAGLALDADDGFTFASDGFGSTLSVGTGGISAAEPAAEASPVYAFEAPLRLTAEQTWNFPAGTTTRFTGGMSSAAGPTKTGDGELFLAGTNVWDGRVIISNGTATVGGTITTSSGVDNTVLSGSSDNPNGANAIYAYLGGTTGGAVNYMNLTNAIVEKAFWVQMASSTTQYYLRTSPASTNEFHSYFRSRNLTNQRIYADVGSEIHFTGGAYFSWAFGIGGPGVARFSGKPITYSATSMTGLHIISGGTIIFEVGTNTIAAMNVQGDGGRFDFMVDDVCGTGDYCTLGLTGSRTGNSTRTALGSVLDIHGTVQHLGALTAMDPVRSGGYVGKSMVTGDDGSLLVITNKSAAKISTVNHVPFAGGVSLRLDSASSMTFTNVACTATGTVEVAAGTMRFEADASWLTATNIVVGDSGRLVLSASGTAPDHQTFGRYATWRMSGNGVVSIPAGVTQKAAFLLVDGTPLPKGDYSYALAKDEGVKAHFDPDAAGVLRVLGDGKGTVIMFK